MFVTFFDSCMVSLAAMMVWRISPFIVFPVWLVFACIDGTFLSSSLTKVPSGAWFTLTLAAVLASLFLLWRYGKESQWAAEAEDRYPTSHFVKTNPDSRIIHLSDKFDGAPLSIIRGFGIYFDKAGETTPTVFSQFILKLTAIAEVTVFFHLRSLEVPSVPAEERHTVSRLSIPNCYRLVVRYGYNDEVITPDLGSVVANQIRKYLRQEAGEEIKDLGSTSDESKELGTKEIVKDSIDESTREKKVSRMEMQLAKLDEACSHNVLYIMGKEQMKIKKGTNYFRATLLWIFLWLRENTRNKMASLSLPTDKIIEVGFLKEI